jgi:galactose mutarotase-like enzyme
VSLRSGELSAEVDPQGAQLSVLRDRTGCDLLWGGNPSVWSGRAPLLFPIVGALAGGSYHLGSRIYHLPRHGFARNRRFEILESTPANAILRLRADAASLEAYPFRFELELHFALDGPTLSLTSWVRNLSDEQMPASFGFHPALRWPLPYGEPRSAHFIEFASDEPAPIRRLNADGLLTPEPHATPISHRRLALADALFQDDAVIFDRLRSRSLSYGADEGPRIRVSFPDSPYLGIWTKPQAEFICIEPWHGIADPIGFSADFRTKPGVFTLAPRAALPIKMALTLLAD